MKPRAWHSSRIDITSSQPVNGALALAERRVGVYVVVVAGSGERNRGVGGRKRTSIVFGVEMRMHDGKYGRRIWPQVALLLDVGELLIA